MSTKIVELSVKCVTKKKARPKPIELVKTVNEAQGILDISCSSPEEFDYVALLVPAKHGTYYAIIVCWDDGDEDDKSVFLGHWNDGVVG